MEIPPQNKARISVLIFFLFTYLLPFAQKTDECEGDLFGMPGYDGLTTEITDTLTFLAMAYTSDFCKSSTKMADFIYDMPKIKSLYILAPGLTEYSSSIGKLETLEALILNKFRGESIPEEISSLKKLKTLQIKNSNSIRAFPFDIGNLKELKELVCDSSKINEFPSSFKHLESLEILEFGSSTMSKFPEEILELKNGLLLFKLNTPKLKALPSNFGDLKFYPQRNDSAELKKGRILLIDCENLEYLPASIRKSHCVLVLQNPRSLRSLRSLNESKVGFEVVFLELKSGFQTRRLLRSLDTGEKLSLDFTDAKFFRRLPHSLLRLKGLTALEISGYNGQHPRKVKRFREKLSRKLPHTRIVIF